MDCLVSVEVGEESELSGMRVSGREFDERTNGEVNCTF